MRQSKYGSSAGALPTLKMDDVELYLTRQADRCREMLKDSPDGWCTKCISFTFCMPGSCCGDRAKCLVSLCPCGGAVVKELDQLAL